MKYIYLYFALLISFPGLAQLRFDYPVKDLEPAEYLVTYTLNYQQDSLNPGFIRQDNMYLLIGRDVSKFVSKDQFVFDTIMSRVSSMSEFQSLLLDTKRPLPMPRFGYRIYKNYPKTKLTYIDHIPSNTFLYEENLDQFHWKLSGDTATIKGYKVQKATCDFGGRSWIAWFSPEIPINDGPYKFNGLPGLILKVNDTRNQYVFEMESIEKPGYKLMIDLIEKDFIKTTKQDFFKAEDAFRDDIISRAKAAGLDNETQQNAAKNMAEHNNPIELKRK